MPSKHIFILLLLTIAVTLVNSNLFVYQTLASYFLYTMVAPFLTVYDCVFLLTSKKFVSYSIALPSMLFIVWTVYVILNISLTIKDIGKAKESNNPIFK